MAGIGEFLNYFAFSDSFNSTALGLYLIPDDTFTGAVSNKDQYLLLEQPQK